jgi:glycosyltransferase involved in cell wall biosynthesis
MSKPISHAAQVWLFTDSAAEYGGHEAMLLRWLQQLQRSARVDCRLLARRGSRLEQQARNVLPTDTLPAGQVPLRLGFAGILREAVKFGRTLSEVRPSICVLVHGFASKAPMYALIARLLGVHTVVYTPLVEPCRAMRFRFGKLRDALTRHLYARLPHAWVTITSEQAADFARWARVRRPIYTLCNTVADEIEVEGASHSPSSRVAAGERACLKVLVLGRLDSKQKGLDLLLDYLEHAQALVGALTINIVGEGPYEADIQRRIRCSRLLATVVSLNPWTSNRIEIMSRHDVLLLPSRYEGVPLVMLEAMCLGLPVVSSDLPGTRAFLSEDCLFPVGDLARAFDIIRTLASPELCGSLAERNWRVFNAHASGAAFANNVERLTDALLGVKASYGATTNGHPESDESHYPSVRAPAALSEEIH